jgi:hypothetical protein
MGLSAEFLYQDGEWELIAGLGQGGDSTSVLGELGLWASFFDGDTGAISYRPTGSGTGSAFLVETTRAYFGRDMGVSPDMDEHFPPSDPQREAQGLAEWWAIGRPVGAADITAKAAVIQPLLASDAADYEVPEDRDLEGLFGQLLTALELPLPDELAS